MKELFSDIGGKVAQNENEMKLHRPGFCLKGMSGLQVQEAEPKS